tara:strand:+ start:481 stop:720 length:240 start_codon:yes stop_codon:yes gene_type:complete
MLLYDGAVACGGDDFISEFVVLVVVDEDSEPDSYVVVAVEVYPPSIAVLLPEVLVCVESANTEVVSNSNIKIIRGVFIC